MAQPPFLVDILQVEPGSGQTLTVSRNAADGALKFADAVIPAGITLSALAGIRNVTGVYVVGRGGDGAPYTSIQDALDAVPTSSDSTSPSLVLVLPGVYEENLSVQKDGVFLTGFGATVKNGAAGHTVEISASQDVTPKTVVFSGLTIQNDEPGYACVKVAGADAFATGTVTVNTAPLATGDLVTIGGINLVGTAGVRTSGSDNFSVSGGTVDAIAAEIAAAINDPANSFLATVGATSVLGVVEVTAIVAGSGGNAITLAVSTTPAGGLTPSGANLTGGSAAGNEVGLEQIRLDGCTLVADAVGGNYQVWSDTANVVRVQGGSFAGSAAASVSQASNTAEFTVSGVFAAGGFSLSYDTGDDQPATLSCAYGLSNLPHAGDVIVNLVGLGGVAITGCGDCGNLTVGGDQSVLVTQSGFDTVTLSDTIAVTMRGGCSRGALVNAGGTPTFAETLATGSLDFAASDTETVTFTVNQPDDDYKVLLDIPGVLYGGVTARTDSDFTVELSGVFTGTVGYTVVRSA